MNKLLKTASLFALLIAAPTVAQAFPLTDGGVIGRYLRATQAAVCGPTWNQVPLRAGGGTHWFNVKEADYIPSVDGSKLWVTGQISHRLSFRPDDQIYYTITYEEGGNGLWKLKDVQSHINRGGWGALLGPLWLVVDALVIASGEKPIPITPEMVNKNTTDTAALVAGNWEDCLKILIADIAVAASNPNFCSMIFEQPTVNEFRLDVCRWWGTDCGKPAADAFCVSKGYTRSNDWNIDYDIGTVTPTQILETGDICNQNFCDGFKFIQCE